MGPVTELLAPTFSADCTIAAPGTTLAGTRTLTDLLYHRAATCADRIAYVTFTDAAEPQVSLTFGALFAAAARIAAELRERGIVRQPVILLYPSGLDFIVAFWAVMLSGNIAVPLPVPRNQQRQEALSAWVRSSGAKALMTTAALLTRLRPGAGARDNVLASLDWIVGECGGPTAPPSFEPYPLVAGDVAVIQFTSGSTGRPRGATLTHTNILSNQRMIQTAFGHREFEPVVVSILPHFHDMGLFGNLLQPFYLGAKCILIAPEVFAQRPRRWLEAMAMFGGTTAGGPNFAYDLCVSRHDPADPPLDLSRWSVAFIGAEPVRLSTIDQFSATFRDYGFRRGSFFPCYGLAEATLFVSGGSIDRVVPAVDADTELACVSCGPVAEGVTVAVIDPNDWTEKAAGEKGEVWLAGASVCSGYWENLEATINSFEGVLTDGQGPFLRTGDIGYMKDGQLFLCGRMRNVIIVNGINFHGEDLEVAACKAHPSIAPGSCAALGFRGDTGEGIVIVAEPRRATLRQFDAAAAGEAIHRAISNAFDIAPAEVVFARVGAIPRTSSGKLRRDACRQMLQSDTLAVLSRWKRDSRKQPKRANAPQGEAHRISQLIVSTVAELLGMSPENVETDEPFPEIGLDSNDLFRIADRLSIQLDLDFDPLVFWECPTIERLSQEIVALLAAKAAP